MGRGSLKLDAALRSVGRLYLDAAPLIDWVEAYPDYISKMDRIVDAIETTPMQALTSVLTLTEVMAQPLRVGNTDLAQEYHDIFVIREDCKLVEISTDIAISAAAIRARHSLRTPDAVPAATAIKSGCEAIRTNDRDFRRLQDLNALILGDLEL